MSSIAMLVALFLSFTGGGPPKPIAIDMDVDTTPFFVDGVPGEAMTLIGKGSYSEACDLLVPLAKKAGDDTTGLRLRYLAGMTCFDAGRNAEAAALLVPLPDKYPLLADYAAFYGALAAKKTGDLSHAAKVHQWVGAGSALYTQALLVSLDALVQTGKCPEAEALYATHKTSIGEEPEALLAHAECLADSGNVKNAMFTYKELMSLHPSAGEVSVAELELESLAAATYGAGSTKAKAALSLSVDQLLAKGAALFAKHHNKAAIKTLQSVLPLVKPGSDEMCDATYHLMRSYEKLRKYKQGLPHLDALTTHCTSWPRYADVLYFGARTARRAGKADLALQLYAKLHAQFPEHSYNDDAYIYEADIHRDKDDMIAFEKALTTSLGLYPKGDMIEQTSWMLVWAAYTDKRYADVIKLADEAIALVGKEEHYYSEGRLLYWKARAFDAMGKPDEAKALYQAVLETYPLSYYAHLAYNRLRIQHGPSAAKAALAKAVAATPATTPDPLAEVDAKLLSKGHIGKGFELLRLGQNVSASREFAKAVSLGATSTWLTAYLFHSSGELAKSHDIARRTATAYKAYYPVGSNQKYWVMGYPLPASWPYAKEATSSGIPWSLAVAISREESGFNPKIKSYAGAMGLMQLMPGTAKTVAKRLKLKTKPTKSKLQQPAFNIKLGCAYLGYLAEEFQHLLLVPAGYNAGEGSVRGWNDAFKGLPLDEYVESIPYRQTRWYTKRVVNTMGIYTYLYTGGTDYLELDF